MATYISIVEMSHHCDFLMWFKWSVFSCNLALKYTKELFKLIVNNKIKKGEISRTNDAHDWSTKKC